MEDLLKALPDDRPITAVCIIEDPAKCPSGFQVVDKTFDQDTDADLWKDGFFGKRITRYICLSKEQGVGSEIIESITVIGEKDQPPEGYILLMYTQDSEHKATRKKHLCYKMLPKDKAQLAVTDVIVLSKSKKPPAGFLLAGELNGLLICYKLRTISPPPRSSVGSSSSNFMPYPMNAQADKKFNGDYPVGGGGGGGYSVTSQSHYLQGSRTLGSQNSVIDDIPFDINPRYRDMKRLTEFTIPDIPIKTEVELEAEYKYDFQVEYQAQQAIPSHLA